MESSAQGAGAAREATQEIPPAAPPPRAVQAGDQDLFAERPELFVGAAFVGGIVLAKLLERVRR